MSLALGSWHLSLTLDDDSDMGILIGTSGTQDEPIIISDEELSLPHMSIPSKLVPAVLDDPPSTPQSVKLIMAPPTDIRDPLVVLNNLGRGRKARVGQSSDWTLHDIESKEEIDRFLLELRDRQPTSSTLAQELDQDFGSIRLQYHEHLLCYGSPPSADLEEWFVKERPFPKEIIDSSR
ncbi:hypothetical protein CTheo_8937 [Ceratobasidium theobromae]|uniref:Uncharacterized protein n=1 Tax=Ceratobasidium theobromae TaxID=1582974 RepID=A0A5N5Q7G8_9AGAM|nr:hypothetical protein CTheo_8937 [Ceratobasidium theobromae]